MCFYRSDQFTPQLFGTQAFDIKAGIRQRTAEDRLLFDQQYLGAGIGSTQCCLQAGRSRADHRQIREQVGLVVVLGLEGQVQHAKAGLLANDRLPDFPHALGLVERAIVETHRHELRELAQVRVPVVVQ